MRISDWSSDVCSSDLTAAGDRRLAGLAGAQSTDSAGARAAAGGASPADPPSGRSHPGYIEVGVPQCADRRRGHGVQRRQDRKSGMSGKSVSVRVDLVGSRSNKKKILKNYTTNVQS